MRLSDSIVNGDRNDHFQLTWPALLSVEISLWIIQRHHSATKLQGISHIEEFFFCFHSVRFDFCRGYQESEILRYVTVVRDLQPLANNCREVLVWHTRTETPKLDAENKLKKDGQKGSDDGMEV